MYIKKVVGHYFRNFKEIEFNIDSSKVFIQGENGIGKTSLLESIYFLASGRGFKKNDNKILINNLSKQADLYLEYIEEDNVHSISAIIQENKKIFAIDGEKIDKISKLLGKLLVISYTPISAYLFKGEPAIKRSFIDELCSTINPNYLHQLQRYKKLLKERNQAFARNYDQDIIKVYAKQLVQCSYLIVNFRKEVINEINNSINKYYNKMFGEEDELFLEYSTNCVINNDWNIYEKENVNLFERNKSSEYINKQTLIGPHKDIIKAYLNRQDIATYGSQGQNRLATISLQLAKRDILNASLKKEPILLLDDVLSDLDDSRAVNLLNEVGKSKQVIITGTKIPKKLNEFVIYTIKNNKVDKEKNNE